MAGFIGNKPTNVPLSSADLPDNIVTSAKIADDAVDSDQLASGAVDDAHLATGITSSKLTGALPAISGASLTNLDARDLENALPAISGASLTGMSSGAWELLHVVNATSATSGITVNTGMSTSYRRYKVCFALKSPSSGVWLYMRTTVSGTAQTSSYSYCSNTVLTDGSHTTENASGQAQLVLGGKTQHGPNQQIHGEIDFADCYAENWYRATYSLAGRKGSSGWETFHSVGTVNSESGSNIDGFVLYFNTGDIQPTSRVFLLGLKGS